MWKRRVGPPPERSIFISQGEVAGWLDWEKQEDATIPEHYRGFLLADWQAGFLAREIAKDWGREPVVVREATTVEAVVVTDRLATCVRRPGGRTVLYRLINRGSF